MSEKFRVFLTDKDEDGQEMPDYRRRLVIERNGKEVEDHWDGGEPEDNSYGRDWRWVCEAIETAYRFGLEDGKTNP